nr:hypothetical protein L204_01105 [Cryptococcus depauperatus CBS 7855]
MVSHATSNLGDREIDIASDALPVVATLRERLDVWRKAPGEKGEIEGEQCSTINEQHSTHMIQHCTNSWMSLNRTTLHDDRMRLIDFMEGVLERNDHLKYLLWALLTFRKRWAIPDRWVGATGLPAGTISRDFCSHTMLQHDAWGEPLSVQYKLLKQIPSDIGRGYCWGRTKQLPLFNTWPATAVSARYDESKNRSMDDGLPGLGDLDCEILADAAEDMVM